jgi:hypothetical protein
LSSRRDSFEALQVLEFASFTVVLEAPTQEAAMEWQQAMDVVLEQVVPTLRSAPSSSRTSDSTLAFSSTDEAQRSAATLSLSGQGSGRGLAS